MAISTQLKMINVKVTYLTLVSYTVSYLYDMSKYSTYLSCLFLQAQINPIGTATKTIGPTTIPAQIKTILSLGWWVGVVLGFLSPEKKQSVQCHNFDVHTSSQQKWLIHRLIDFNFWTCSPLKRATCLEKRKVHCSVHILQLCTYWSASDSTQRGLNLVAWL